jgi:hypothetical protein
MIFPILIVVYAVHGADRPGPDAGVQKVKTSTAAQAKYAYSKEDLELARYMDVLQQDHDLLKNLEVLRLLPALED